MSDFLAGESFNGDYFIRNALTPMHVLLMVAAGHKQKRFILHMDNSLAHKSKGVQAKLSQISVLLAPYPPYSHDLPPSGFSFSFSDI
jgi:transposase